jgi:very-short-patch-repair endonuclease
MSKKKPSLSGDPSQPSPRRPVRSEAEECLAEALEADPLPGWDLVREYRFHPERRWRFDFAFPGVKLGVEVDGRGHFRGKMSTDYDKQNEATRLGWRVLRFQSGQKRKAAEWAAFIREVLVSQP